MPLISVSKLIFPEGESRDSSGRKRAEEELRRSEAKNKVILDAIPDLLLLIKMDGSVLDFRSAQGYDLIMEPALLLGNNINQAWPKKLAKEFNYYMEEAMKTKTNQVFDYELIIKGVRNFQEARLVRNSPDDFLVLIRDITERKLMEEKLIYLSNHDCLTGLYNRGVFEQEMTRLEEEQFAPVGIIICDVDGLKLVNDTLGHLAGDILLKTTAELISQCFDDECKARIGGDEFCILAPNTSMDYLIEAERLIQNKVERYNRTNRALPLSISVGYALGQTPQTWVSDIFKEADNFMNRKKLHHCKSTRSSIVQALLKALEARDFITEGHGDRLQELVEGLALFLNFSEGKIRDLCLFAQFHDLGKVGIPDRILFKPGLLTTEEVVEMQRHSEIGHRIAYSAPDLMPIADWILKHHEWWNGQGYPLGLEGEEIPLECRILAIADAYDAMTNDRPYRMALTHQEAIHQLKLGAGTQFDPNLVELFVDK